MSLNGWKKFVTDSAVSGALASTTTALAAAARGKAEDGEPVAPVNSVSHILWGDKAANQTEPSLKYTMTGVLLNAAAVVGWAAVNHGIKRLTGAKGPIGDAAAGLATTGLAYVTDYKVVPDRLTPGFELRLSNKSLGVVYGALAAGLVVGGLLLSRRR